MKYNPLTGEIYIYKDEFVKNELPLIDEMGRLAGMRGVFAKMWSVHRSHDGCIHDYE
jgi:hypothetical protein